MKFRLVKKTSRFVPQSNCQRSDLECLMPGGLRNWEHRAIRAHKAVEIFDNALAFDQHVSVIKHHSGDTGEGVIRPNLLGIPECRPGTMFERDFIDRQRNADAANERRIILADEDHCGARVSRAGGNVESRNTDLKSVIKIKEDLKTDCNRSKSVVSIHKGTKRIIPQTSVCTRSGETPSPRVLVVQLLTRLDRSVAAA